VNVLVACEFSGRVRDAFIACGHDAVSCDLRWSETPGPHHRGDVRPLLIKPWDLIIAFPPCTYLTSSNASRWHSISEERAEALLFVWDIMDACSPRIAIENPKGAIGTFIRAADQYVQPWEFGDPYTKTTGLWLKGLPKLRPEVTVRPDNVTRWVSAGYGAERGTYGQARHPDDRGKTFPGLARAMAEQWGEKC
jgi:hypothetical protein